MSVNNSFFTEKTNLFLTSKFNIKPISYEREFFSIER